MNILICDDVEEDAAWLATLIVESDSNVQTVVFTDSQQAFEYFLSGTEIDACFLDIIMPRMNGIKLAEKLRKSNFTNDIVFLTTSNDFASQSYQVQAFDYLLKPLTVEKVSNVITKLKKAHENADKDGLTVMAQSVARFIMFRHISHVEVVSHNVYIKLLDKSLVKAYGTFNKIAEQLLADGRFAQCHRSFIVNLDEITTVTNNELTMKNGSRIPISRGYLQVKDKILKRMFK